MKLPLICLATLALAGVAQAAPAGHLKLTSPDLPAGKPIPEFIVGHDYGCSGGGQSPELKWTGVPAGTKSFAITMFDPFRPPQSGWWHWIVYDINPETRGLPRNAGAPGGAMPSGAKQGTPDADAPEHRFYGPCPDKGDPPHHYIITLYALNVDHLDIPATASAADIDYTASSHVIEKTSLTRDYKR